MHWIIRNKLTLHFSTLQKHLTQFHINDFSLSSTIMEFEIIHITGSRHGLLNEHSKVLLNGVKSSSVSVSSGVPQGTVLGLLMFLLYINNIIIDIDSPLRIFADDCLLYKIINIPEDTTILQKDLDQITTWISTWQLRLNIFKYVVIHCGRSHSPIAPHQYTLNNCVLQQTNSHLYLGVMLDRSLSWSQHVTNIVKENHQTH